MGLLSRVDTHSSRLEAHRALVIGGSGGVGRSISYQLASMGAAVIVHGGHDAEKLERVVGYIRDRGGRARGLLRRLDRASDLLPDLESCGRIDILVVAFGPIVYADLASTTDADWERMASLNLALPGMLVSRTLPGMVQRGWGRIVLFGGPHGDTLRGFARIGAYAAAKAGLASLCKSAARQTRGRNVTVNMIAPGYVDTEFLTDAERELARKRSPRGKLIPAEHVARLAVQLVAADDADINGACIAMDQGLA